VWGAVRPRFHWQYRQQQRRQHQQRRRRTFHSTPLLRARTQVPVLALTPELAASARRRAADNARYGFGGANHHAHIKLTMNAVQANASACLAARTCNPLGACCPAGIAAWQLHNWALTAHALRQPPQQCSTQPAAHPHLAPARQPRRLSADGMLPWRACS
jgi:hypothetical protein